MSIEEKSIEAISPEQKQPSTTDERQRGSWAGLLRRNPILSRFATLTSRFVRGIPPLRSPLWVCLLVALLIRAWLTYHTHGVIDGDEALVGIQAEHILRGQHPFYFYGQVYMGSLEAYL